MGNTYIDKVLADANSNKHVYEDFLVRAEIEHAKARIVDATNLKRRDVAWSYGYNDYDSYTNECVNLFEKDFNEHSYKIGMSDIGMFCCGGLDSYLSQYISENPPQIPVNHYLDYRYIEKNLEAGLRNLGCKTVSLYIGPKSVSERRLKKKGLFNETYETITHNVVKWMVSIAW